MRIALLNPVPSLLGVYGAWVAISWGVYGISGLMPQSLLDLPVISSLYFSLTALLFVVAGCQVNVWYFIYTETAFQKNALIRWFFMLAVLILSGLMYAAAVRWEINTPLFYMVYTANLIVFANLLGAWLIKALKREAELILVCVVMGLADLFSIIRGPTLHVVEAITTYYEAGMAGPPPFVDFLLIKIPVPGLDHLQPVFGVSDWIIIVFLSAATVLFKINDNLAGRGLYRMAAESRPSFYFPVAAAGLAAAIFTADLLNRFIPALPVIAGLFICFLLIRYPAARQLKRSDWRVLGVFCGIMLALLLLALIMTR